MCLFSLNTNKHTHFHIVYLILTRNPKTECPTLECRENCWVEQRQFTDFSGYCTVEYSRAGYSLGGHWPNERCRCLKYAPRITLGGIWEAKYIYVTKSTFYISPNTRNNFWKLFQLRQIDNIWDRQRTKIVIKTVIYPSESSIYSITC